MEKTSNYPTEENVNDVKKQRISREEMVGILNESLGKQDTFKAFLDELAQKTRDFDDFVGKISIWLELGREKEFFERAMKQAIQIEGPIDRWKKLIPEISKQKSTEMIYLQTRVRIAFEKTGFKLGVLELINLMVDYKMFDFYKNSSSNILPDIDDSGNGVPSLKFPTKKKVSGNYKPTILPTENFKEVLERIRTQSSDFNDFLARVSDWLGIDTELFIRVIEGGVSLNEKTTVENLQSRAIFSKKERTILEKACEQKSEETGMQIGFFRDVVRGCIKKRELFKEIKMKEIRERYLKMTGESNSGRLLTKEEEQHLRKKINSLFQKIKVPEIKRDALIRFAGDVSEEITSLKQEHISLSLQMAEYLQKVFVSREFCIALTALKRICEVSAIELSTAQQEVITLWARTIEREFGKAQDLETLRKLRDMISDDMARKQPLQLGVLKNHIREKIRRIELKEKLKKLSPEMEALAGRIVRDENFDAQKENQAIDQETDKQTVKKDKNQQVDSAKNNDLKDSLKPTNQQVRKLIVQKISSKIGDESTNYMITLQPVKVIRRLEEIGTHPMMAVDAIISNLIGVNNFARCKTLLLMIENEKKFGESMIISWRKKVSNAEVANVFLSGMNGDRTAQDEQTDYEFIENMIRENRIDPKAVKLGNRLDGTTITLADIWSDEPAVIR